MLCHFLSNQTKLERSGLVLDCLMIHCEWSRQDISGCCVYLSSKGGLLFQRHLQKVYNFDKLKVKSLYYIAITELVK